MLGFSPKQALLSKENWFKLDSPSNFPRHLASNHVRYHPISFPVSTPVISSVWLRCCTSWNFRRIQIFSLNAQNARCGDAHRASNWITALNHCFDIQLVAHETEYNFIRRNFFSVSKLSEFHIVYTDRCICLSSDSKLHVLYTFHAPWKHPMFFTQIIKFLLFWNKHRDSETFQLNSLFIWFQHYTFYIFIALICLH